MSTWHFVRDGVLTGESVTIPDGDDPQRFTPPGCVAVADPTGYAPPPELPVQRKARALEQVLALEAHQPRLLRALALDPNDQTARARLAALEAEITVLRLQMRGDV
jgi:hypothetical protein